MELSADVLVVGAGGAGMYAAVAADGAGADVLLLDKSLVGRGGATVMAQMTVAAAIGQQEPDDWTEHAADTVGAGRGLCNEELTFLLCRFGPERVLEMDRWGVGWARESGHIRQVKAPGHSRRRCLYVDFLATGPAVAATLRRRVARAPSIRRISNVAVIDLLVDDRHVAGALALDVVTGEPVAIAARRVVLAAGGLTKLYARNSASANMAGDPYAIALRAGAELVDMEFVQFFPIAHLWPRLVGMDPIMWDPFRYKLGGRLLNGRNEEFLDRYGSSDEGTYVAMRDLATYAIVKEVEAGRGSPHGGVYLDFRHVGESRLREAFGPVIDRLLDNGIDLTQTPVEVAPTAHYHMGGIRTDASLETCVGGLFAAGEAVGGANGANRLSGNAITEALVFGERAGRLAAESLRPDRHHTPERTWRNLARDGIRRMKDVSDRTRSRTGLSPAAVQAQLQQLMQERVGPLRDATRLETALRQVRDWQAGLDGLALSSEQPFNMDLQDWFELRNMLSVAEVVALAAFGRQESRGTHQREDFPAPDPEWARNQVAVLNDGLLNLRRCAVIQAAATDLPA
jgi:succinate dehydrogenase / fumarate reductase flavoprotein subunit